MNFKSLKIVMPPVECKKGYVGSTDSTAPFQKFSALLPYCTHSGSCKGKGATFGPEKGLRAVCSGLFGTVWG